MTDIIERLKNEIDLCRNDGAHDIADLLGDAAKKIIAQKDALSQNDALLQEALDLFDGTYELCDNVPDERWIWKHKVREYFFERSGNARAEALKP